MVTNRWFDHVIIFFIGFSCITLAMERPSIEPDSMERQFLTYSNYLFVAIFSIEMTLKLICFGLLMGKDAYWKSAWNILDSILVVVSFLDLILPLIASNSGNLSILRVF